MTQLAKEAKTPEEIIHSRLSVSGDVLMIVAIFLAVVGFCFAVNSSRDEVIAVAFRSFIILLVGIPASYVLKGLALLVKNSAK